MNDSTGPENDADYTDVQNNPRYPSALDPDHAIAPGRKEDRLGFRPVADQLAASLLTQVTSEGMVFSIEGEWGSGKSSLVNLLADSLEKNETLPSVVLRFEPWLVGDRDALLSELLSDLASAVESSQAGATDSNGEIKRTSKELAEQIRGYASKLSRKTAPLATLAGALGVPGAGALATALETVAEAAGTAPPPKPLPQMKNEVMESLGKLDRRIFIIIDDLDRLEPNEAVEIMRLIKAVANFPKRPTRN
jgi:predicted KAP-like P-loop ATPase